MRILSLVLCLLPICLLADTLVICPTCDHSSIASAHESANDGDLLLIQEGTYKEHGLLITKPISLIGQGEVIVDGEFKGTVLSFQCDDFILKGLTIKNVGHSYTKDYAAILVRGAKGFKIIDNKIENTFFGILIEKSKNGVVEGNVVSSRSESEAASGNGVHIWHSSKMTVRRNELHHMRDGIYFEFVSDSEISNNLSHDNIRYGLHFMFSNHDVYSENTFSGNGAGVAVMFSKYINMSGNTFEDNWGAASYGLLLKEIYDAVIENNNFIRNTTAITAEGSTRISYTGNVFSSNGWAVKIAGACYENVFTGNDFINNSFDLSYNGQLNDNKFERNYWSAYSGYDLDKNGIGDIPFRPVKLFAYVVNRTPETMVLLRSLFVDIINFSEKVSPVFTPDDLMDEYPLMKPVG